MTYRGRVQDGVIILEGAERPREGAIVRVEEEQPSLPIAEGLTRLAGKALGLPSDLAEKHDHYRRDRK